MADNTLGGMMMKVLFRNSQVTLMFVIILKGMPKLPSNKFRVKNLLPFDVIFKTKRQKCSKNISPVC